MPLFLALYFCFNSANAQSNLEGRWELVKQVLTLPDTSYTRTGEDAANMVKIINQKIFVTVALRDSIQHSMFNWGYYELTDDTYTENIEYFSYPEEIGKSYTFKSKIENDIWTIEGPIKREGEELPVWKTYEKYRKVE